MALTRTVSVPWGLFRFAEVGGLFGGSLDLTYDPRTGELQLGFTLENWVKLDPLGDYPTEPVSIDTRVGIDWEPFGISPDNTYVVFAESYDSVKTVDTTETDGTVIIVTSDPSPAELDPLEMSGTIPDDLGIGPIDGSVKTVIDYGTGTPYDEMDEDLQYELDNSMRSTEDDWTLEQSDEYEASDPDLESGTEEHDETSDAESLK